MLRRADAVTRTTVKAFTLITEVFIFAGATGPIGAPGAEGATGFAGAVGRRGDYGPDGVVGDEGPQGFPGSSGIDGVQGDIGSRGEIGKPHINLPSQKHEYRKVESDVLLVISVFTYFLFICLMQVSPVPGELRALQAAVAPSVTRDSVVFVAQLVNLAQVAPPAREGRRVLWVFLVERDQTALQVQ